MKFTGLFAWFILLVGSGNRLEQLIQAPEGFALKMRNPGKAQKPTLVFWLNSNCPLSRQYAPTMKKFIRVAGQLQWNTILVSVQDATCDPVFQELGANDYIMDQGALARWFNVSIVPTAMLFRQIPGLHEPAANLVYRGAIDDWALETGKHRQYVNHHYLNDAIKELQMGKLPDVTHTKSIGCFIE
jgi:hypothetical protein